MPGNLDRHRNSNWQDQVAEDFIGNLEGPRTEPDMDDWNPKLDNEWESRSTLDHYWYSRRNIERWEQLRGDARSLLGRS